MAFSKGQGGRTPGSQNKTTSAIKEVYEGILQNNSNRIQTALDRVYGDSPAKFLDIMVKLSDFIIPKLKAVDTQIDVAEGSIEKIVVEIKTKPQE